MEHAEIYLRVKSGAGREKGEGETAKGRQLVTFLFFFAYWTIPVARSIMTAMPRH